MEKSKHILEISKAFLKLGLTSFGGPIAHIGYFYREFVVKRAWLSDFQFSQLLALCNLLPGPASSQLGLCIGLLRGGWLGAIIAFILFTLPSALLLTIFAGLYTPETAKTFWMQGFKLVAVIVVASGLCKMLLKFCAEVSLASLALLSASLILLFGPSLQIVVIILCGIAGTLISPKSHPLALTDFVIPYSRRTGVVFLSILILLLLLSQLPASNRLFVTFKLFYQSGTLVFGGGHVVLPLLQEATVNNQLISNDQFLSGYGMAQAVPGPMFSFAAFLGKSISLPGQEIVGTAVATISIFLPGFLLVLGILPFIKFLNLSTLTPGFLAGINAGVVGILAAALYNPIIVSAIYSPVDIFIVLIGFLLLHVFNFNSLVVILWCVISKYYGCWLTDGCIVN